MDIDTSGAQGGVVQQLSMSQKAAEMAMTQKTDQLSAQGVQFETVNNAVNNQNNVSENNAPNVSTSPTYSPSLYAQAAQFQLYTQSGVLALLMAQQGTAPPVDVPYQSDSTDIHAVEGPSAATIDTQA